MTRNEARGRVEAFVADFHERWQRSGRQPDIGVFDFAAFQVWEGELAELASAHGVPGFRTGQEGALSSHPAHDPAGEQITDVEVDGGTATVRSVIQTAGNTTYYYKYGLLRGEEGWRISQVWTFLEPPGAPLVEPGLADALMLAPTTDTRLPDLPAHLELNVPGLFTLGRVAATLDGPGQIEVHRLGELTCASGVLTVLDFGFVDARFLPLRRRVPPGTYPIEVSVVSGVTAAVRLLLSERQAISWHPAEFTDGSRVVGVDAGNVALLDAGSLVECQAQRVAELFQEHAPQLMGTPGTMFGLTSEAVDAAMVSSGYGDGAYPCYWGMADDGGLTSIVVDFRVLAENILDTSRVPFHPGPVSTPELAALELEVTSDGGSFVISNRGEDITGLRVFAPDGRLLMDGDRLGTFMTGDRTSKTWRPDAPPPPASILEVTRYLGYRHI